MPTNTVQDRALVAGIIRRAQSRILWLNTTVPVGVSGQFTEINLVGATTTIGPDNRLTITITGGGGGGVASVTGVTPIVVDNTDPANPVIHHATSGVTPGIYGDAGHVVILQIDADGHIVAAAPQAIAFPSSTSIILLDLSSDTQSTKFASGTKLTVGRKFFDPSAARWGLSASSTATFYALMEVTNGSNTAACELYRETGTGSPVVVGTPSTTNNTTAFLVSANVTSAFLNSSNSGIFAARVWVGTSNGNDEATCSGSWIEIKP